MKEVSASWNTNYLTKNAHKTTIFKGYKKNLSTGPNMLRNKKKFPFE
jgi:hypothetical protein